MLLHGNGSMIQDFEFSGLLDMAAARYRVIAFDRPGYGHTIRPRDRVWSPEAQADLIDQALTNLGASPAVVFGHSWGASVAVALALRHPASVRALVPASGYYYPTPRVDAVAASGPAVPIFGDILRYTVTPLLGRVLWPALMRKIFRPAKVPAKFAEGFPKALALRPSQLRASAAESALMVPEAWSASDSYGALRMPVVIVAGARDHLIDTATAIGAAARRYRAQQVPCGRRSRAHGASDSDARGDGSDRRGGRDERGSDPKSRPRNERRSIRLF